MIVLWLIVLIAVVGLISVLRGQPALWKNFAGTDDAVEFLRKRYARGEIDKAEYDARRRDLQHQ